MHQERFPHQTTRPPSPTSQRHLSTPMAETANSPNWLQKHPGTNRFQILYRKLASSVQKRVSRSGMHKTAQKRTTQAPPISVSPRRPRPYFRSTLEFGPCDTANSPNWLQNTLEQTDPKHLIETWLRLSKKEFRSPLRPRTHKTAQTCTIGRRSNRPLARSPPPPLGHENEPVFPLRLPPQHTRIRIQHHLHRRPRHRHAKTHPPPSPVCTHLVNVFPCPN
jgi:hypothetical protein